MTKEEFLERMDGAVGFLLKKPFSSINVRGVCTALITTFGDKPFIRVKFKNITKNDFKVINSAYWLYDYELSYDMNQFYRIMVLGYFKEWCLETGYYKELRL